MTSATIFEKLHQNSGRNGASFVLLLDPDEARRDHLPEAIANAVSAGVDAFFVGGSLLIENHFDDFVSLIKRYSEGVPVILFPGNIQQVSSRADAILFLSLLSGRNPEYLIGQQVAAAPLIQQAGIESIACGYLLIESGSITSVEFVSNTRPIPRNKIDIALAHALAAQFMGMKMVYLEAGSGARFPVPDEMIRRVSASVNIPVAVGGGIRTAEEAARKVQAGARWTDPPAAAPAPAPGLLLGQHDGSFGRARLGPGPQFVLGARRAAQVAVGLAEASLQERLQQVRGRTPRPQPIAPALHDLDRIAGRL